MEKYALASIILGMCAWAFKTLYSLKDKDLQKNTESIQQLTLAVMELKVKMDYVNARLEDQKKMKDDITSLHRKLRESGNSK